MNDSRSLTRYSARSSERLFAAWITSTLNIITGSSGGLPPFARSEYASAASRAGPEQLEVHGSRERLQLVAQIAEALQAVLNIKEARLPTPPLSSANRSSRRSRQPFRREGF
jgi:hypothetical protein